MPEQRFNIFRAYVSSEPKSQRIIRGLADVWSAVEPWAAPLVIIASALGAMWLIAWIEAGGPGL